jgi:flagellar L-ring protein precursor FlgH
MKTVFGSSSKIAAVAVMFVMVAASLQGGSLWREGVTNERGMFADKRAKCVGDIVTVVVQESATLSTTLNSSTSKDSKGGVQELGSNLVNQFITAVPNPLFGKRSQANAAKRGIVIPSLPQLSATGANSFTGGGSIKNDQSMTARAAVQVVDVLPNGNLVIEGLRDISFSKERQFASLRGIIRPDDIQPDNTVLSSNVADAQVQIVTEGSLTDAQRKGWLQRLNDKISPF